MYLPDIIGIGAPKSGTTSFVKALDATGRFDVCRMKDSDILSSNEFARLQPLYRREFNNDGRPKVDFSVLYFLSDLAAENFKQMPQKVKLVFLARDPIEQIKS